MRSERERTDTTGSTGGAKPARGPVASAAPRAADEAPGAALAAEHRPATAVLSADGLVVSCDDEWLSLAAAPAAEVLGRLPFESACFARDRDRLHRAVDGVVRERASASVAHRVVRTDGTVAWLHTWIVPVPGDARGILAVSEETTDRVALVQLGDQLRAALDETTDHVILETGDGRVLYVNRAARRAYGVADDADVATLDARAIYPPAMRERFAEDVGPTLAREGIWRDDVTMPTADGDTIPLSVVCVARRAPDGAIEHIATLGRDIRDLKDAEARLTASAEWFQSLVQHSNDIISVSDAHGRCRYVSPSIEPLLGYPPEFPFVEDGLDLVHPEDRESVAAMQRELRARPGATITHEYRFLGSDGRYRHIQSHVTNLLDDPRVNGIVANSRDVTDARRAQEALQRGEERLQALLQNSTDFVLVWDEDGNITYVTPSVRRFLGAALDRHTPGQALDITHEDDRARVDAVLARVRATPGAEEAMRFRGRRADGEYRWLETVVTNLTEDLAVGGIVLNARDVTAQVAAEHALHESHDALRRSNSTMTAILENAPLAIYAIDRDCNVILWNRACETLFGIPAADALGRYLPMINDDEVERFEQLCAHVAEGRVFNGIESRTVRPDGRPVDISLSVAPMVGPNGAITGMLLLCADITDRKQTERALLANEAMFRGVVQHASDLILIVGRDGLIRYASPAAESVFGYAPDEAIGLDPLSFVHPDDVERVALELAESLVEAGPRTPSEFRVRHADGSYRTVQSVGHNLMDDPAVEALIVTARDITEQRSSEIALRRSEERFRALVQNLSEMITVIGSDGELVYSSPSAVEFFGNTGVHLEDRASVIHPDDVERVTEAFVHRVANPTSDRAPMRYRVRRADGEWRHVESVVLDLSEDPAVGGVVVTTRDVTEQREAQERIAASEERYRAIVEDQTEFIARVDRHGRFTFVNDAYARYMGSTPEELLGGRLADVLGEEGAERASEHVSRISADGGTLALERQVTMPDGATRWQAWTTRAIVDEAGRVVEYQSIGRDVTERKKAEARLAEQAKILELVAEGRPLAQTLEAVARAVEAGLGGARCSIVLLEEGSRRLHCIAAPSMPDGFAADVERIDVGDDVASGLVSMGDVVIVEDLVADERWGERYGRIARGLGFRGVWSTPVRSASERRAPRKAAPGIPAPSERDPTASSASVLGALTVYFDDVRTPLPEDRQLVDQMVHLTAIAIERKEFESQLAHQAHHDPLTGLPNRVLFLEFLDVALARSRRRDTTVGVLFLDLDRFKYVNDSFGHDAGDELLTSLARRLRSVVRPGDTIARFGGDEFVVLCEDLTPGLAREQAVDVAERLIAAIQQPFSRQGESQFLSTSIGIALSTGEDDRPEALLRDADAAMYRAKERGKGRWELFDEAMRATALRRVETENALHRAVERNEFRVFYQPVMSLRDGTCVGAEALVRWQHPDRGLVSPAEFITLAEETGLVVPLGRWVLEEACRQTAHWHRVRGGGPFTVSVNLSARQLARAELVGEVAAALDASGVAPECISLEITESVLMEDVEASLGAIKALRALGVRLGIDDFGTGYSSLGYLKRLPVDTVKVDQSFVDGLGTDAEDSAIVAAVVNLGHTLTLNVVAEGVETEEQLAELVALGCDSAQGFLFAPALPPTEFEALLAPGALWRPTRGALPGPFGEAHERRAG